MFTDSIRHALRTVGSMFSDSTLYALGFIGCVLAVFVLARWLAGRSPGVRRKDPRICPGCYNVVKRRHASTCPYCATELIPNRRVEALPPRAEPVRKASVDEVRKAPVDEEWKLEQALREEWRREERAYRRKVFLYPLLLGWCVGMVLFAVLFLFLR